MSMSSDLSYTSIMRQVNRMVAFIELEGREKADAILNKCEEEYNLILGNLVQAGRRQLVLEYDKKQKAFAKDCVMQETIMRNKLKMNLTSTRQELMSNLVEEIQNKLNEDVKNESFYKDLMKKLIIQSLCILIEKEVIVKVKECDKDLTNSIISDVKDEFKQLTEIDVKINVANKHLPDSCIGGVVIYNKKCSLKVTNTIMEKYQIILDKIAMSIMRNIIFGANPNRKFDD